MIKPDYRKERLTEDEQMERNLKLANCHFPEEERRMDQLYHARVAAKKKSDDERIARLLADADNTEPPKGSPLLTWFIIGISFWAFAAGVTWLIYNLFRA